MAAADGGRVWALDRYARHVQHEQGKAAGRWHHYDNTDDATLAMTLTDTDHLVVVRGSLILESHSLATARAWMRGLSKQDSLLVLYKFTKGTRRFKVKFAAVGDKTGSDVCSEAAARLSGLFSVHVTKAQPQTDAPHSQEDGAPGVAERANPRHVLQGEVSLATMTQVVLGATHSQLPKVYSDGSGMTSLTDDVMANHLRLFLGDPSFPAFVEQVDRQLQAIVSDCDN